MAMSVSDFALRIELEVSVTTLFLLLIERSLCLRKSSYEMVRWAGLLPGRVNPRWLRCLSTKFLDELVLLFMPLEKKKIAQFKGGGVWFI